MAQAPFNKRYTPEASDTPFRIEQAFAFTFPSRPGYFINGDLEANANGADAFLASVDSAGTPQWAVQWDSEVDYFIDHEGHLLLHDYRAGEGVRRVAKFDLTEGGVEPEPEALYGLELPAAEEGHVTLRSTDGGVVLAEPGATQIRVIWISSDGEVTAIRDYALEGEPDNLSLTETSDGGLLLTWTHGTSFFGFTFPEASIALKLDVAGDIEWSRRLELPETDPTSPEPAGLPVHFHEMPDGGFLAFSGLMSPDATAAKLTADGQLAWAKTYEGVMITNPGAFQLSAYRLLGVLMEENTDGFEDGFDDGFDDDFDFGDDFGDDFGGLFSQGLMSFHEDEGGGSDPVVLNLDPATGETTDSGGVRLANDGIIQGWGERQGQVFLGVVEYSAEGRQEGAHVARFESDLSQPFVRSVSSSPGVILGDDQHLLPFTEWESENRALYLLTRDNDLEDGACEILGETDAEGFSPQVTVTDTASQWASSSPEIAMTEVESEDVAQPGSIPLTGFELVAEDGCPQDEPGSILPPGLTIRPADDDQVRLSWSAQATAQYSLQFTPTLSTPWETIEVIEPNADGTVERLEQRNEVSGFYRLRAEPMP